MPSAYEGTDIISYLLRKYIIRLAPYIISPKAIYHGDKESALAELNCPLCFIVGCVFQKFCRLLDLFHSIFLGTYLQLTLELLQFE